MLKVSSTFSQNSVNSSRQTAKTIAACMTSDAQAAIRLQLPCVVVCLVIMMSNYICNHICIVQITLKYSKFFGIVLSVHFVAVAATVAAIVAAPTIALCYTAVTCEILFGLPRKTV